MTRAIMLVGSVPLANSTEVFETVGGHLGPLIGRIPDGETGERLQFIAFQDAVVSTARGLERRGEWIIAGKASPLYGLEEGVSPDEVEFAALGYAKAAIASHADFVRARDAGRVAQGTRFQVSLPTPLTVLIKYASRESLLALWPVYERAMLAEVDAMLAAIPHEDLAIQWDVAPEVHTVVEQPDTDVAQIVSLDMLAEAIGRIIDHVPADVPAGCHFCYGDSGHKHIIEPRDMGNLVRIANAVAAAARRPIEWMHMPVPRGRDDDAYFAPLAGLQIDPETELFLGLVHMSDGVDGARGRVAAARSVRQDFGVATECGLGRRDPASIGPLLDLHRDIATTL
jgi:hypothetical protein